MKLVHDLGGGRLAEYNPSASATATAVSFGTDSVSSYNAVTGNGSNPSRFTWSSYIAEMAKHKWPADELRNTYAMADSFGLIPAKLKNALSAKPKPKVVIPAASSTREPVTHVPVKKSGFNIPVVPIAIAGAAALAFVFIVRPRLRARSA